jgi:DNA mismatch repair protein MutS
MITDLETSTPLMKQYAEIAKQHPETLLLFQVGDFYELFFDDAKAAAAFLGIALTKRGKINGEPIPLCGVPVHALDYYLTKLVRGGFKVAICDQLEEAKPGTVVRRGVTQVITPGTIIDAKMLDEKSANYLFSFFPTADRWGLLFGELLTAQLFATTLPISSEKVLESELVRFFPDEVLLPNTKYARDIQPLFKRLGYFTTIEHLDLNSAQEMQSIDQWVKAQFPADATTLIANNEALRLALYHFYAYMRKNQEGSLAQFRHLNYYQPDDFLLLDAATQKNLELVRSPDGTTKNTLLSLMDMAVTSMGSRMVKKWLLRPLVKQEAIVQRQEVVGAMMQDIGCMQQLEQLLREIGDIERVVGRIALRRAPLNDYLMLSRSFAYIPLIKELLTGHSNLVLMRVILSHMPDFSALKQLLDAALNTDSTKQWIIKSGFDQHLDYVRSLIEDSTSKIIALEMKEQQETGISSLKIRFTQAFGYYIEVTKANLDAVPTHYLRQQTLVGRERFITPELQKLQNDITQAQSQIAVVEKEVFERIQNEVAQHVNALRKLAQAFAHLDALFGFAKCAYQHGYVRPTFNTQRDIIIVDGRHPVVEQSLGALFIPNSTHLTDSQSLWIITGPNMGGKSTYLRQTALICVMAQCGSFVPAQRADVALLDRIFTRIGASDNVADGKSTFLVEMEETAAICTQATPKSLVILDEVGRGTSTFDGLAIAQAVVEYIYSTVQARCLFATHYHELTELEQQLPGIVSYHAASKKQADGILLLHKIVHGVADGSFGLEVARLAELPPVLVKRAQEILTLLTSAEQSRVQHQLFKPAQRETVELEQMVQRLQMQVQKHEQFTALLKTIDFDAMSPKKAFDLLWELKELV